MPHHGDPESAVPTPTSASSGSHNRVKSVNTEKAVSVKTSRSSTRYATDRPSSSVSKAKSSKSHRDAQNKYIVNPYIYQMTKMALASPTMMHWSRAPVSGMLPTRHLRAHSMTLVGSTIWIFGGTDESDSRDDVYTLDTETFVWGKPKASGDLPPPSRAHTATLVQDRFIFIVGGGQDFVYYNTLYIFDTLTHKWTCPDIQSEKPIPRRAHTACLHDGRLFIFGGGNGTVALNDVWAMDVTVPFTQLRWEQIKPRDGPIPRPRGYHTSNLVGNVMVIIGGSDGRDCYDDIWVMDLDTGLWKEVKTDDKYSCMFHSSTQVGSYLFVLGGHNSQSFVSDLVLFNLGKLIVTGGFDGETVYDDVSILDLAALAYLPQVTRFGIIIDEQGVYVEDEGAEYHDEAYME